MKELNNSNARSILIIASVLLFAYVALRAMLLSFTHDECFTYLNYVRGSWENINHLTYTNNHLLNTWLMKLCYMCFGDSEFALRLPNVLSFILFLFFGGKLLLQLNDPRVIIVGWMFLNLNPFVLDFFSLARGYGLSMGLMMTGLYGAFLLFYSANSIRNLLLAMIPVCLAVLANLTMINFLVAFSFSISLLALLSRAGLPMNGLLERRRWWPIILIPLLLLGIELKFMLPVMFELKSTGNFDFGGQTGFWTDTVMSLVTASVYDEHVFGRSTAILLQLLILIPLLYFCLRPLLFIFSNQMIERLSFAGILSFILLQCVAAIIFLNMVLAIPYSVDRAAIYFIPLFSCIFIFWIASRNSVKWKNILNGLLVAISLILFVPSVNLHHCLLWKYDSETKEVVTKLEEQFVKDNYKPGLKAVGINFLYKPSFNYYRFRKGIRDLEPSLHDEEPAKGKFDHYILPPGQGSGYGRMIYSPASKVVELIKADHVLQFNELKKFDPLDFDLESSGGRSWILNTKAAFNGSHVEVIGPKHEFGSSFVDTIRNAETYKSTLATMSAMFKGGKGEASALLVISVERAGKLIFWRGMNTRDFIVKDEEWSKATFSAYLPDELMENDRIICYMWNDGKIELWTDHLTLSIYKLQ